MGLEFALDELYATGWSHSGTPGCSYHTDGRAFPSTERIKQEFAAAGYTLTIEHAPAYNCYRATWSSPDGDAPGAVVGHTEAESVVFALAHLRRHLLAATA
jgi:hypothetical protein